MGGESSVLQLAAGALLLGAASGAPAQATGRDTGFAQRVCSKGSACHSLAEGVHGAGPSLHALAGREAGQLDGFPYSKPLRDADVVWNAATLNGFLVSPQLFVPGNRMPFAGLKNNEERTVLISYLLGDPACQ